jgi:hypothetical protein
MIDTRKYLRKPLYVDAVRITGGNFDEISAWCQGEILHDELPNNVTGKKYIKVRVHNPKNPRQTKAYVGDWLLYTERGYKVYTSKAFHAAFDLVEENAPLSDPRLTGDPVVDGAAPDTVVEIEAVPATPEAIAQAVIANEAARESEMISQAVTREEETRIVETASSIAAGAQTMREVVEGAPEKIDHEAVAGKRVLSIEEQSEMTPEAIRSAVQSGEAVLIQEV